MKLVKTYLSESIKHLSPISKEEKIKHWNKSWAILFKLNASLMAPRLAQLITIATNEDSNSTYALIKVLNEVPESNLHLGDFLDILDTNYDIKEIYCGLFDTLEEKIKDEALRDLKDKLFYSLTH